MSIKEEYLKELPEIKNVRHEAFIMDYLKTYNQVDSYKKFYPEASYNSAMSSSSALIKRYREFIDTYHFLKMKTHLEKKEQLDKDKEEAEVYLNPFKLIIEKGKIAFSNNSRNIGTKNEAVSEMLKLAGGDVLARYLAQEIIKEFELMPEEKDKEDEGSKEETEKTKESKESESTNKEE